MPRLIMLLIGSGMFKALWYWIPPITILAGREPISYGFCQGAGFLLAVGIEASGPFLQRISLQYHHLLNLLDQMPLSSSSQSIQPSQYSRLVRSIPRLACIAIDGEPTHIGRCSRYSWRHWRSSIQAVLMCRREPSAISHHVRFGTA